MASLLADLGPRLRRGGEIQEPLPLHPTGLPDVDQLLGGGFSGGRLSEICGPGSSGRTSLALSLLARATGHGQLAAVVDLADAFDPPSALAFGVHLPSVLWVRAAGWREALGCARLLLGTEGFPLVLLDLPARKSSADGETPRSTWLQLSRLAASTRTALVVLSPERCTDSCAEVALEMQPARARFTRSPFLLLEELETRAVLTRHRTRPAQRAAPLRLGSVAAA